VSFVIVVILAAIVFLWGRFVGAFIERRLTAKKHQPELVGRELWCQCSTCTGLREANAREKRA
jgi:hypothetical protein